METGWAGRRLSTAKGKIEVREVFKGNLKMLPYDRCLGKIEGKVQRPAGKFFLVEIEVALGVTGPLVVPVVRQRAGGGRRGRACGRAAVRRALGDGQLQDVQGFLPLSRLKERELE